MADSGQKQREREKEGDVLQRSEATLGLKLLALQNNDSRNVFSCTERT